MGTIDRLLHRPTKALLGLLYPAQCPCCGQLVDLGSHAVPAWRVQAALCPDCWQEAQFIHGPTCLRCGAPQPGAAEYEACDDCLTIARPWQSGRAALVYSGTGRELVLALKHRDRPEIAPVLGTWLSDAAAPIIAPGMIVVPVPLHYRRLLKRRYNQSALISRHLARRHGLSFMPDLLLRRRYTAMQDHRDIAGRFANITGAITVNPRRHTKITDRQFLLVDDVMTSGATLAACTEALLDSGAAAVHIAVLARALKDD